MSRAVTAQLQPSRRRRTRSGMTLIEIMVVVAIIAVVGGSAAVLALGYIERARVQIATSRAGTIKGTAIEFLLDDSDCPTVLDLLDEGVLDEDSDTNDPWGNDYEIECRGNNVVVYSPGPDGDRDTDDDITTKKQRDNG